jgi:hypothetical protein
VGGDALEWMLRSRDPRASSARCALPGTPASARAYGVCRLPALSESSSALRPILAASTLACLSTSLAATPPATVRPDGIALVRASVPDATRGGQLASDLDAFMERVLVRRDENWRKLQQYVLDEREQAELVGPGGERLFGLHREYTWYIRDGVFVRSPVRFDGVTLDDSERRAYEAKWIARERQREAERERRRGTSEPPPPTGEPVETGRDALARLTQEPQFVSAAYFLRFRFEPGHYALVGREPFDGREVLRIEYYPSRLFTDDERTEKRGSGRDAGEEDRITRQMNKAALVTLWIDRDAHQIVQYTFENTDLDFLPGRSLVRLDDLRATMTMAQPFPGVWLPRTIDAHGAVTFATGSYEVRYGIHYHDYREADVKVRIR